MLSNIINKFSKKWDIRKGDIETWYILGAFFTIIMGTLLHFIYPWSGNNAIVGIFGTVNDSTWEHFKLFFWPQLFFLFMEGPAIREKIKAISSSDMNLKNYYTAKAVSFYIGIALMFSLFYTYTVIFRRSMILIDILIFIISIFASQYIGYKIFTGHYYLGVKVNNISITSIILLTFVFVFFTFNPPDMPIFKNPETMSTAYMFYK